MSGERPASRTAWRVAVLRAAHQLLDRPRVLDDPIALPILGEETAAALRIDPAAEDREPFDRFLRAFMVARYGDFILFRPRFTARTAWLWLAPGALLLIGALVLLRVLRQRAALLPHDDAPVDEDRAT